MSEKKPVPVVLTYILLKKNCHREIRMEFMVNEVAFGKVFSEHEENIAYG